MLCLYLHKIVFIKWFTIVLFGGNDIMDVLGRENQISKMGQARFEAVFYHASIGIDIIDETGRIVDCNPALEKMFGYSRAELRAMTYMDLTHPDDVVEGRNLHLDLLAGRCEDFQIEKRYVRKDKTLLWARLTMSLFETETSDSQLVMGMIEDVTDQKESELALRESEERFRRLSNAAFEGIFIHQGGVILDANEQFAHLLGFESGDDLIGRMGWRFVGRDARRSVIRHIRNKDERPFEGTIVAKTGEVVPVEVVGREIPWAGKTVGVVAIRNIRDRKDAESAQRFLENQLFQAERMATVGTVASGIVHNLKGPLTRILGFADLLDLKFPDEEFITHIQTATKQMNEMVENILVKGRQKPKPEYVDLEHLLGRELEFLATDRYYKTGIKTQVSFGDDVPSFLCAYTDLSQIFGNLLRNAVEAMFDREKKELGISTYVKAGFICVDIQDSGCGIAQERVATLFDAFVTTKDGDGKTAPQGTGLGLYMVRQLLKQYEALVEVFSEEDVGTLFQVRLPLSDEAP